MAPLASLTFWDRTSECIARDAPLRLTRPPPEGAPARPLAEAEPQARRSEAGRRSRTVRFPRRPHGPLALLTSWDPTTQCIPGFGTRAVTIP